MIERLLVDERAARPARRPRPPSTCCASTGTTSPSARAGSTSELAASWRAREEGVRGGDDARCCEGLMQDDFPLTLHHIRRRMRSCNPGARGRHAARADGVVERATLRRGLPSASTASRARSRGSASSRATASATFAWNNQRHLELYLAVPCIGRGAAHAQHPPVRGAAHLHRQPRRGQGDLRRRLARAGAREARAELRDGRALRRDGRRRRRRRCRTRCATRSCWRRPAPGAFDYPELDERQAAALCYTSGTTGNPKGVALLAPLDQPALDGDADDGRARALARATACWRSCRCSTPTPGACRYGAALAGADLILPDRFLQAEPLAKLIAAERPTLMGCVPTIFADLLRYADEHPDVDLSSLTQRRLRRLGGAAAADEGLRGAPRRAHLPGAGA